jgi:Pyruvate/2-oxoacid:ferredoxin oxidoreductase gamma subunit
VQVQTVFTETVVRATQQETKSKTGRRKIAPALTRQEINTIVDPAPGLAAAGVAAAEAPAAAAAAAAAADSTAAGAAAAMAFAAATGAVPAHVGDSLEVAACCCL